MAEEHTLNNFDSGAIIIGFTGSIGSGCSTISKILEETKGYKYYKLSSIIYEHADQEGIEKNRGNLQSIGNELRKKGGPHYLSRKIMEKIDEDCKTQTITMNLSPLSRQKIGLYMVHC